MNADITFVCLMAIALVFQIIYIRFRVWGEDKLLSSIFATITAILWFIPVPVYLGSSPTFYGVIYIFVALGIFNVVLALESAIIGAYETMTRANRRGTLFE